MELRLVLEAAGIAAGAQSRRGRWRLIVAAEDVSAAQRELEEYRRENQSRSTETVSVTPTYAGAAIGVVVYAAVVVVIGLSTLPWGLGGDLFTPGEMQAGKVLAGDAWRCVTALTLHVDEGHLASNLLFGILFGFLAGRTVGGGIAWFSIVSAGAVGNWLNALVQQPEHRSVGASTAVFAALGLLVAAALRPRRSSGESLLRRWRPLVAGVMLLALIGVGGERTDVTAHVTGFFAGLLIGAISSRIPTRWLADERTQWLAGLATFAVVTLAWVVALSVT
ncbi:Rhomboid family protein [Stieleria maiorica]|uniref:Rhomboid family protein n=2 Tax=Stieleria maiorica TaxID=2795974 RepID=A0A5B9MFQ9_9BACT|nr:Rhomboid family protein [Stieleria maiorica]